MRSILIILILLYSLMLQAQQELVLSGKIVDQETQQPLQDAYIIYQHKTRGTIADINGVFTIPLSDATDTDDTLYITHLGYHSTAVPVHEMMAKSTIALIPTSYTLPDMHVLADRTRNKDWKKIFQQAVGTYDQLRRKTPWLAFGQYAEEARYQGTPVMYTEGLGYILYLGIQDKVAPYSNVSFYSDQLRSYVSHPDWHQYRTNMSGDPFTPINSGSNSNLNFLRVEEETGVLSPRKARKYKCSLDTAYYFRQVPVYVLHVEKGNDKGKVQILEVDGHYLIKSLDLRDDSYWSTAYNKRVPANVSIEFQYMRNTPFVKSIFCSYKMEGLEYENRMVSLIQKLDTFSLSWDQYWSLSAFSQNPFISFDPSEYDRLASPEFKEHFEGVEADFEKHGIDLDDKFTESQGHWYLHEPKDDRGIRLIDSLGRVMFVEEL